MDNTSAIAIVDHLLEQAYQWQASDIHIDPQAGSVRVRFRVDGRLQDFGHIPLTMHDQIISRLKVLSGLRTDEHHMAQDGRFRVTTADHSFDVRLSIAPTYYGENA